MKNFRIQYWPTDLKPLRFMAYPVTEITNEIEQVSIELVEKMQKHDGYGISANQIGYLKRIIVVKIDDKPVVMLNPEIINHSSTSSKVMEGCISIPDFYEEVLRYDNVIVSYIDLDGEEQAINTNNLDKEKNKLVSRCVQHEIDHLDGKLFIDYMSEIKRNRARKTVKKYFRKKK